MFPFFLFVYVLQINSNEHVLFRSWDTWNNPEFKNQKIKDLSITSNLFVTIFDLILGVCVGASPLISLCLIFPLELFLFSQSQEIVCLLSSAFCVCRFSPLSELLQKLGLEMVPETESTWLFQLLWALLVGEWDLLVIDWAGTWLHPRTLILSEPQNSQFWRFPLCGLNLLGHLYTH